MLDPRGAAAVGKAPDTYKAFIEKARQFVEAKGLSWTIRIGDDGTVRRAEDWDLRILTDSHARNASRLNGFSVDTGLRDRALAAGWAAASLPAGQALGKDAQDFLKALVAFRCGQAILPRTARHEARIYRKFLSVTRKMPWHLSTEDFDRFMMLGHSDSKLAVVVAGLARVMSENMLSVHVPLEPDVRKELKIQIEKQLADRRGGSKLPDAEALHELIRIVFQEAPRSHQDLIRFCVIRLLVLTGLRINEVVLLPADCLRWEAYVDVVTGKPADEVGGISRALRLRYFAEKHEEGRPDVLVEEHQWVPQRFHDLVAATIDIALRSTITLRREFSDRNTGLRRFKTTADVDVSTTDMLFLVLHGGRGELPSPIPENARLEVVSEISLYEFLGVVRRKGRETVFTRYGKTANVDQMKIKPHSLRHLMNTELFRLNVPDTAITLHFGRQSVAQSYEYDHRTLAERLAFVQLPAVAAKIIEPESPQELVAKMVIGGLVADSHIAKSFKAIQLAEGDEAAYRYLCANSDGFHVTPYGFCTNSFSVRPCVRHLKCLDKCNHFLASGMEEHKTSLELLHKRLVAMRVAAAARPEESVGRRNQIAHAEQLIAGVEAALAAQPLEAIFPAGHDHSSAGKDLFQ